MQYAILLLTLPSIFNWFNIFPAEASTILSIGDGDTITVTGGSKRIKVRLACIDAPENSQTPYGYASKKTLQGLLPIGSQVTLRTKTTDRYGRKVAEVLTGSTNINHYLVGTGNAFVYWQYIRGCDRQTYSSLENNARLNGLGIWNVPNGIKRPWDYRRERKAGTKGALQRSTSNKRRYRCSEIRTWRNAQELLRQGHTYLDRDGDGEACESKRK